MSNIIIWGMFFVQWMFLVSTYAVSGQTLHCGRVSISVYICNVIGFIFLSAHELEYKQGCIESEKTYLVVWLFWGGGAFGDIDKLLVVVFCQVRWRGVAK